MKVERTLDPDSPESFGRVTHRAGSQQVRIQESNEKFKCLESAAGNEGSSREINIDVSAIP